MYKQLYVPQRPMVDTGIHKYTNQVREESKWTYWGWLCYTLGLSKSVLDTRDNWSQQQNHVQAAEILCHYIK